ncbi:hypothetical protein ACGFYZ_02990 [Streptomyces sp. NPDC048330]|uniref:hypothetical protein n=1 Tax=Streptomyces sp. NPDC048330 TaxID=3365533 RepID=UPI0037228624
MRGPAAPTSPGAWDARSEALLGAPALTPSGGPDPRAAATGLDLRAPDSPDPTEATVPGDPAGPADPADPVDAAGPAGIAPIPEAAAPTRQEPGAALPAGPPGDRPDAPVGGTAWRTEQAAAARADARAPSPGASAAPRPRRGHADPVKVLMHRHRDLCERAVDPLEIAAGLEAQGFTDRTAARFRHRDVFSLAEELYARVPRGQGTPAPTAGPEPDRTPWALAVLAPGAVAGLAGIALTFAYGPLRTALAALAVPALGAALVLAVRRGPFRVPAGGTVPAARLWTLWLLAYAVGGDGLLAQVLSGGPDGVWDLDPGPLLGLALAVAPAAWCAHLFARRARLRIAESRGLADFAAATRPLLLGTVALQLLALAALLAATGFSPGALALGALLLLARLLTVHGHPETASAALAAAGAAEALALASVLAARVPLPGFDGLAAPVRALVDSWGPGAVPTLVCGAAALGLLAHATGALARASAHATP